MKTSAQKPPEDAGPPVPVAVFVCKTRLAEGVQVPAVDLAGVNCGIEQAGGASTIFVWSATEEAMQRLATECTRLEGDANAA